MSIKRVLDSHFCFYGLSGNVIYFLRTCCCNSSQCIFCFDTQMLSRSICTLKKTNFLDYDIIIENQTELLRSYLDGCSNHFSLLMSRMTISRPFTLMTPSLTNSARLRSSEYLCMPKLSAIIFRDSLSLMTLLCCAAASERR